MVIKKGRSQVTFVYKPAENCRQVELCGSFNNWRPKSDKMSRQKDGSFRKRMTLNPGEYRYKFIVDGHWIEDPQAERQVPNSFGTCDSVVTVG